VSLHNLLHFDHAYVEALEASGIELFWALLEHPMEDSIPAPE
jgi:hypothetical protein